MPMGAPLSRSARWDRLRSSSSSTIHRLRFRDATRRLTYSSVTRLASGASRAGWVESFVESVMERRERAFVRRELSGAMLAAMLMAVTPATAQQPPPIGIAPVTLSAGPYVFDTAEQHKIRVDVVVRGLAHPFSLVFLP